MRFAAAGAKLQFTPTNFSGSGGQGIGQAGSMASLNRTFAAFRNKAPNYGRIGQASIAASNQKWRAAQTAKTSILSTGLKWQGAVKSAKIVADAQKSAAQKASRGAMIGSAIGAIGSIGGALLSDERCKHEIKDLKNALTMLQDLKPVTFYYNEEYSCSPERLHFGFVAQEYEKLLPDQTYYDPTIDRMCIDTNELIAILVRGIQELNTKVTRLEAKSALEKV